MEEKEKRELVYRITTDIVSRRNFVDIKQDFKYIFRQIEQAVNELEDEDSDEK